MSDPLNGAQWKVDEGDCLTWLRGLADNCVDIVVTSPIYNQLGKSINPNERKLGDRHRDRFFQRMASVAPAEDNSAHRPGAATEHGGR